MMTIEQDRVRSREQALAEHAARTQKARRAYLLTAVGIVVAALALSNVVSSFSLPALIFLLLGLAASVGGLLVTRERMANARYRIPKPFSAVVATLKVAGVLAVTFGLVQLAIALDLPNALLRPVVVAGMLGALAGVSWDHSLKWTAFQADLARVHFGRNIVQWQHIAAFVVANGVKPDTVEIGIRTRDGAMITATHPGTGGVLTDLPVHTVAPAAKFRWDRLRWAIRESGQHIALLERTIDGEHPHNG